MPLNVEIKARCNDLAFIRNILKELHADFKGTDLQTDTYFNAPHGRLKLRIGNIENNLIFYNRSNDAGPKASHVTLYKSSDAPALHAALQAAMGILAEVKKEREIYFIGNVKFHLDTVAVLGHFAEIEAIDTDGKHTAQELQQQCEKYMELFGIEASQLVSVSYSDMLLAAAGKHAAT